MDKPGATSDEFEATKAACISRASARFPPMMRQVQIGTGYTTPMTTSCNGNGYGYSMNCSTVGGQYVPPSALTVDDNSNARLQDVRSCFFENGWRPDDQAQASPPPRGQLDWTGGNNPR
jgi:hypothetical protein